MYCLCFGISTVVVLIFGGLHAWRAGNAGKINQDYLGKKGDFLNDGKRVVDFEIGNSYDLCNIPAVIRDPTIHPADYNILEEDAANYCKERGDDCYKGTQWYITFYGNAVVLCLSAANFIFMTFGAFFFWARYAGVFCNFCYACCHMYCCFIGLSAAFGPLGLLCTANIAGNAYEGNQIFNDSTTYKSDG